MREITTEELILVAGGDSTSDIELEPDFGLQDNNWDDMQRVEIHGERMNSDAKDLYDAQQMGGVAGTLGQIVINLFGNPNYH